MHFNDGYLLQEHWNNALIELVNTLGPKNVFVSIYESGSWDHTKDVLRVLDWELGQRGVRRKVEISDETHEGERAKEDRGEGWVVTPRDQTEPRRIPFLARLRNKTLKDLVELHEQGIEFDKIVFLNDVVFTVCFSFDHMFLSMIDLHQANANL